MSKDIFFSGQPVFTQLLSFLPQKRIEWIAKKHNADHYVKTLTSYRHLVVMLFACFEKCESLRVLITGLQAWQNRLKHLGINHYPRKSTLSDAGARRTSDFFQDVYIALLKAHEKRFSPDSRGKKYRERSFLIDSTTIELFTDVMQGAGTAKASGKRKGGVKAHMLIDSVHHIPQIVYLTEAKENDRIFMNKIVVPRGSFLIFDKGYTKHSQWQRWTEQNIYWITRLNENAYYEVVQNLDVSDAQRKKGVISDQVVWLGKGTHYSTEIIPARRIVYYDKEKNRTFEFVTNHERIKPATIAAFYKSRWDIETTFKALKQNFQLRYFLGETENAIKIQIWSALIAHLLIKIILSMVTRKKYAYSNVRELVRMHLSTYVNILQFLKSPEKALQKTLVSNQNIQMEIKFNST